MAGAVTYALANDDPVLFPDPLTLEELEQIYPGEEAEVGGHKRPGKSLEAVEAPPGAADQNAPFEP